MPEFHLPLLATSIFVVLLIIARVYVPWVGAPAGAPVRRVPLSLLGRLRMHAIPGVIGLGLALFVTALGVVPPAIIAVVAVAFALLIALPMVYTLTTDGVMAGHTPMRRWTQFGGVTRQRGGVRLQSVTGARPMTVWLSGSRDDDETVLLLRQLVRGAYKGGVDRDLNAAVASDRTPALPAAVLDQVGMVGS